MEGKTDPETRGRTGGMIWKILYINCQILSDLAVIYCHVLQKFLPLAEKSD